MSRQRRRRWPAGPCTWPETYELDGASVLCLGDHDLTSLAVGSVAPDADLTVVDIDEPILDHVADSADSLGFPLTAAWADLRLALPPSLVGTADLVFTDPPYTTEGMRLFLTRALEALRPTGHERLAFCFGTGERHLVKALEVQALLGDLRLALEAMLPGFNHYDGAEAIGSRSDLYICRPDQGCEGRRIRRHPLRAAPSRPGQPASTPAVPPPRKPQPRRYRNPCGPPPSPPPAKGPSSWSVTVGTTRPLNCRTSSNALRPGRRPPGPARSRSPEPRSSTPTRTTAAPPSEPSS